MQGQIVHDSLHRREGWTHSFRLLLDESTVGFGSVAISGPWAGKPTLYEFYVLPERRDRAFDLFEAFLRVSGGRHFEVQTHEELLTVMLHTYGTEIESESIVFRDGGTTSLPCPGGHLRCTTPEDEIRAAMAQRHDGGEWVIDVDGQEAAKGGILFHYNVPYGDIYYEVPEAFRRRGFGAYLTQELKRRCYELGAIPCARCNRDNVASRRTLQRAGFVPSGHILVGSLRPGMEVR